MISESSVRHFYAQLCTDAEKSRDQIIRSKNPLLVKLKCTQKSTLEHPIEWYKCTTHRHAHAHAHGVILTRATKVEKAFSLSFPAPGWWQRRTHSLNKYSTYRRNMKKKNGLIISWDVTAICYLGYRTRLQVTKFHWHLFLYIPTN